MRIDASTGLRPQSPMMADVRMLPAYGGPRDGGEIQNQGPYAVFEDGSVYRFEEDRWIFCGADSFECGNCGNIVDASKREIRWRINSCPLCGG